MENNSPSNLQMKLTLLLLYDKGISEIKTKELSLL